MDIPKLVYDFYVMVGLRHRAVEAEDVPFVLPADDLSCLFLTTDSCTAIAIQEARKTIIEQLWGILLRDVPFILSAEIRHIYDNCHLHPDNPKFFLNNLGQTGLEWFKIYDLMLSGNPAPVPVYEVEDIFKNGSQNPGYCASYHSAMTASKATGLPLHVVAETVFDKNAGAHWSGAFGGAAWKRIASTFGELVAARDIETASLVIDQLLALEHNTSTMFNKCHHWATPDEGYGWIKTALDLKFSAVNPLLLVGSCSPNVRNLALSVRDTFSNLDPNKRARLSLDYEGKECISEENTKMVEALSVGDVVALMYKGVVRAFTIKHVDKSLGTTVYTMHAKGWSENAGVKNGKPLLISKFTFLAEDVLASIQGSQTASVEVKCATGLAHFAKATYDAVAKFIQVSGVNGVSLGSLIASDGMHRFRMTRGSKCFRMYLTATEKEYRIHYSTSLVADFAPSLPFVFHSADKMKDDIAFATFVGDLLHTAMTHLMGE